MRRLDLSVCRLAAACGGVVGSVAESEDAKRLDCTGSSRRFGFRAQTATRAWPRTGGRESGAEARAVSRDGGTGASYGCPHGISRSGGRVAGVGGEPVCPSGPAKALFFELRTKRQRDPMPRMELPQENTGIAKEGLFLCVLCALCG